MTSVAILYPAFAMFCLTVSLVFFMGIRRNKAVQNREVKATFYRTYDEGKEPAHIRLITRHVHNHFETPPLFYIGVIMAYVTGNESMFVLVCAWSYVILRGVHTFVHLNGNHVMRRFMTFGLSLFALIGLWGGVFFQLVQQTL